MLTASDQVGSGSRPPMCQGVGGKDRRLEYSSRLVGWGIDQVRNGIGGSCCQAFSALDFRRGHRPDWSSRALAGKVIVTAAMDDDGGERIG